MMSLIIMLILLIVIACCLVLLHLTNKDLQKYKAALPANINNIEKHNIFDLSDSVCKKDIDDLKNRIQRLKNKRVLIVVIVLIVGFIKFYFFNY